MRGHGWIHQADQGARVRQIRETWRVWPAGIPAEIAVSNAMRYAVSDGHSWTFLERIYVYDHEGD